MFKSIEALASKKNFNLTTWREKKKMPHIFG
jgi:hypothetical protein